MVLNKSDNELLQEISDKLSKLTAVVAIRDMEKNAQVNYLVNTGFSNSEIARLIGMPKGTVDGIRASAKKKGVK